MEDHEEAALRGVGVKEMEEERQMVQQESTMKNSAHW